MAGLSACSWQTAARRPAHRGDHELDRSHGSRAPLDLATLLKRPETSRTGIYILLGDDPQSLGGTLAYLGEGDEVRIRLM
jgi:hypothetical protein